MRLPPLVVALVFFCFGASMVRAYVFLEPLTKWPDGRVTIHEQLGTGSGTLLDGSTSWDEAFEGSLDTWNAYLGRIRLSPVRSSTAAIGDGNEINNVFFSSSVHGKPFNDNIIAVTTEWYYEGSGVRAESDIVFNNKFRWNSYRGPLRNGVHDIFRIGLHQLGYALGLGNPDKNGQDVAAIMNSTIADLDTLALDDIAGAVALYGTPRGVPSTNEARADTDALGVATFTLPGSLPFPVQFVDQVTGSPIPGMQTLMVAGANGAAVMMLYDPLGRYVPRFYPVQLPGSRQASVQGEGVQFPLGVARDGLRPLRIEVSSSTVDSNAASVNWTVDASSAGVVAPWDAAVRAYVRVFGGTSVSERDGTLAEIASLAELKTFVNPNEIAKDFDFEMIAGVIGGPQAAAVYSAYAKARDLRDLVRIASGFPVEGFFECKGYSPNQRFRITVMRVTLRSGAFLEHRVPLDITLARPYDPPARPPCGTTQETGAVSGRVVDAKTGQGIIAVIHGFGPTSFKHGSLADGTFKRQYLPPGTYWLRVEAGDHQHDYEIVAPVRVRANETTVAMTDQRGTIPLNPSPTQIAVQCPPTTAGNCTVVEPNGVITLRAVLVARDSIPAQPNFSWHSDNPSVATIDRTSGRATGLRAGSTRITASSQRLSSEPVTLTVVPANRLEVAPTLLPFTVTIGQGNPASQTVKISSPGRSIPWQATSTKDWLSISPASGVTSGSGTSASVSVVASRVSRQNVPGEIRFTSPEVPGQEIVVAVPVEIRECSFTVSTTGLPATVAAAGGRFRVPITAPTGCAWTAASNVTWMTVVEESAPRGTGNGAVIVTVAGNTGLTRSGTVTIAGQAVTVNQAGAMAPPPAINVTGRWVEDPIPDIHPSLVVNLTQTGTTVTGNAANLPAGATGGFTGTVNGTTVRLNEVFSYSASEAGVSMTCTARIAHVLQATSTSMTGDWTSLSSCVFNLPVPIQAPPPVESRGRSRFTRQQ